MLEERRRQHHERLRRLEQKTKRGINTPGTEEEDYTYEAGPGGIGTRTLRYGDSVLYTAADTLIRIDRDSFLPTGTLSLGYVPASLAQYGNYVYVGTVSSGSNPCIHKVSISSFTVVDTIASGLTSTYYGNYPISLLIDSTGTYMYAFFY